MLVVRIWLQCILHGNEYLCFSTSTGARDTCFATARLHEKGWPSSSYNRNLIKLKEEHGKRAKTLLRSKVPDKHQSNQVCRGGVWFVQQKCEGPLSSHWGHRLSEADSCFSEPLWGFPSTSQGKWRQSENIHSKGGNINPYGCVLGEGPRTPYTGFDPLDLRAGRDSQDLIFPGCEHKMSTSFLFLLSVFAGDKFRASAGACKRDFLTGLSKGVSHQNRFPPSTVMCGWWKPGDCVFPAVFHWPC